MRRFILTAVLLTLLPIAVGCASSDEYWTMPLTRWAYGEGQIHKLLLAPGPAVNSAEAAVAILAIYGVILLTPIVVDTAVLPITVSHDIWLCLQRRRHP